MALDPRFTSIVAAAGAAAAALSPQGAAVTTTLTALLQAAADFQAAQAAGEVTDADLAAIIAKADANLAGLRQDIAAQAVDPPEQA